MIALLFNTPSYQKWRAENSGNQLKLNIRGPELKYFHGVQLLPYEILFYILLDDPMIKKDIITSKSKIKKNIKVSGTSKSGGGGSNGDLPPPQKKKWGCFKSLGLLVITLKAWVKLQPFPALWTFLSLVYVLRFWRDEHNFYFIVIFILWGLLMFNSYSYKGFKLSNFIHYIKQIFLNYVLKVDKI